MTLTAAALGRRKLLTTVAVGAAAAGTGRSVAQPARPHPVAHAAAHVEGTKPALTEVATFEQQVTGVAVTKDGRSQFPTLGEGRAGLGRGGDEERRAQAVSGRRLEQLEQP